MSHPVETWEAETVVESIVQDIVGNVLSNYHEFILNHSAKRFTAKQCKDSLVCMLEGAFMSRDGGEPTIASDPNWNPGEEPTPCKLDSRARGSVPLRVKKRKPAAK
eukprot:m.11348 g.11348  ORF g.11348 m.11348 type:complete len:106 (-) comp8767_c0_seq2:279-596(-)